MRLPTAGKGMLEVDEQRDAWIQYKGNAFAQPSSSTLSSLEPLESISHSFRFLDHGHQLFESSFIIQQDGKSSV